MDLDRRDTARRAEVVRNVLAEIVHNPAPVITMEAVRDALEVSPEAATRILERLVSAGLLQPAEGGVWVRVTP